MVRADARELIAGFAERGTCELVDDLAEPIPLRALCHVLGLDAANADRIRELGQAFVRSFGDPQQERESFAAIAEFGTAEVVRRRTEPRDDLLTELASAEIDGTPLTTAQIGLYMVSFLNAGHLTTVTGLGGLFVDVLGDPELWYRLAAHPELIPDAAEESLRLRPPFYGFFRQSSQESRFGDVVVPADRSIYLSFLAGNLGPDEFPDPETFRLHREHRRILTFGHGIHTCPGAPIARMELRVVLEELLAQLPDIELVDPQAARFALAPSGTGVSVENIAARFTPRRPAPAG